MQASFFEEVSNDTIFAYQYIDKFETRDNDSIKLKLLNEDKRIKVCIIILFNDSLSKMI